MLENLTDRLSRVVKTMRGQARLTEDNTAEMLREIRLALLEADVALPVVKSLLEQIKFKALGEEVVGSLSPGQALVGVVQRELAQVMMGDTNQSGELNLATQPPAVILMAGLQGAGKTTSVGKLAKWLQEKKKKKVLTVSCDVYRPAAIEQLETVTKQVGAEFFPSNVNQKPNDIATAALDWARRHYFDVVIVDTAGRLGIDEALMQEIKTLHASLNPIETLFVVDAMLGQDAVNTAKAFHEALPLTGVILTKLDGDSRGGAALSVRQVTGVPLKFIGVAEKMDGLEAFDAERMANRILGMGDILALVEQAQQHVDVAKAEKLANKISKGGFDLEDFRDQLMQMQKMGGMASLMDKLPSQMAQAASKTNMNAADKQTKRMRGIIDSMTPRERTKPELLKASRKRRIAAGAGVEVQEVNRLLAQFEQMQTMMKQFKGGKMARTMAAMAAKGAAKGIGGLFKK
ncbi:signal recognition particle protein [Polynucleobacter asymbioticus]|jgi:signal recognition particle subunit SRP54|uniref:Signal recognition particle protein n=1 Tax=Polynucleobacter asymbioticus (strain DSM 18221 / CIP 109841 / QLW-P1DMWA-1) TaxID=312153 RepID=A4SVA8_POLAQ|nr:signal recognition particle protein [Polynucleobacter asymbioticus]ABP33422.1 signal recognition particle subunit FFH/SRP54 (srp54) [Polynucleobacter asymbioticus QLW-P1DMWA-1]APC05219.1 signal recognition particle protein [Polynucleobacter asymbioticus]